MNNNGVVYLCFLVFRGVHPFLSGCAVVFAFVTAAEIALLLETAAIGNLSEGAVAVLQHQLGDFQAVIGDIVNDRLSGYQLEYSAKMGCADVAQLGELIDSQSACVIVSDFFKGRFNDRIIFF